jgi:hypothetical protein
MEAMLEKIAALISNNSGAPVNVAQIASIDDEAEKLYLYFLNIVTKKGREPRRFDDWLERHNGGVDGDDAADAATPAAKAVRP